LSRKLGIPVVAAAARQKIGMTELLASIYDVAGGTYICKPRRLKGMINKELELAIVELTDLLKEKYPKLPNLRWVALRLLEGDQRLIEAVKNNELGVLSKASLESDGF
jgi:ferrous iron transport protein B